MMRDDKLPNRCPKCGTPTRWHAPTYVPGPSPHLSLRCRCGFLMTAPTNDADPSNTGGGR